MATDNTVLCFEGIQRIYRNAVVEHIRRCMRDAFPSDFDDRLRRPFKEEEWKKIEADARSSRAAGQLGAAIADAFDLLSVNHFFNIFDSYFESLIPKATDRRARQAFLGWVKEIKDLRDPMSHPVTQPFPLEDAYRLLDCARRVLMQLDLSVPASEIQALLDELIGRGDSADVNPLDDGLPSQESVVVAFVGRSAELTELRQWFGNPVARRWALAGEGGKGKSALAYKFAVEVRDAAPPPFQTVLWLSAKQKRFVEGHSVPIADPDFADLDSALNFILTHYGWGESLTQPLETRRNTVLDLLREFPALVVVDDVDSLSAENEDVIEFFGIAVPETKSKVLFTSRRTIFGMGGTTTHVSGFLPAELEGFIQSRCALMELDPAAFRGKTTALVKGTEGSPLYLEDLMRLSATVGSVDEAIRLWSGRGGEEARQYALGRECELLTADSREVLFAACVGPHAVSFAELEAVTGFSQARVSSALHDLQRLFLVPKPRLIEGEQRFDVNVNTKALVRDVYGNSATFRRVESAHRIISQGLPRVGRGEVPGLIRQALFLVRQHEHEKAETLLQSALERYPAEPHLTAVLGVVYKSWEPARITDARQMFARAAQLKSRREDTYVHWWWLEGRSGEWVRAVAAAEAGIANVGRTRALLYVLGRARVMNAKALFGGLHSTKANAELKEARRVLEEALKLPESPQATNAEIYRTLVILCELAGEKNGLRHYFRKWRREHPDDDNLEFEWDRVRSRMPADDFEFLEAPEER